MRGKNKELSCNYPLAVAGHLPDSDRESADSCSHLRLPVPDGQHLLAGVVVLQPVGPLAASRSAFPDLLRHVRLHGCRLHWWAITQQSPSHSFFTSPWSEFAHLTTQSSVLRLIQVRSTGKSKCHKRSAESVIILDCSGQNICECHEQFMLSKINVFNLYRAVSPFKSILNVLGSLCWSLIDVKHKCPVQSLSTCTYLTYNVKNCNPPHKG